MQQIFVSSFNPESESVSAIKSLDNSHLPCSNNHSYCMSLLKMKSVNIFNLSPFYVLQQKAS